MSRRESQQPLLEAEEEGAAERGQPPAAVAGDLEAAHGAAAAPSAREGLLLEAVKAYRTDFWSRAADAGADMMASAFRLKSRVVSHPIMVSLLICISRVMFVYDFVSDGLVAANLMEHGNPWWGRCVVTFMILPYVILVAVLTPLVSRRMAQKYRALPRAAAAAAWLTFGAPCCLLADGYLQLRYLCADPHHVEEFHYMTLRRIMELLEAQAQLCLQIYIWVRQTNPGGLFPPVENAGVKLYLLASSILSSLYAAFETYLQLSAFAKFQTGGHKVRFLKHMCSLGEGLAPSNLFTLLRNRRRVVISYDLTGVERREMKELGATAKSSKVLEELVFENCGWIQALLPAVNSPSVVGFILRDFLSAPHIRRVEFRGGLFPEKLLQSVTGVCACHTSLEEVFIEGHGTFNGKFVQNLPSAHALLQAARRSDARAVPGAPRAPTEVHAHALCVAAGSNSPGSLEVLRALLLYEGGLDAANSQGGENCGLAFAGDGSYPLHWAACSDNDRTLRLLLVAGAAVDCRDASKYMPIHAAANNGCLKAVRALLAADGSLLEATQGNGCTPLFFAAQQNAVDILRHLIKSRAVVDRAPDLGPNAGSTPLFMASQNNGAESIVALLKAGADPDRVRNSDGCPPIWMAAKTNSIEVAEILLRHKADPNKASRQGTTALTIGAQQGSTECVQMLIKAGGDVHKKNSKGRSPLAAAASSGHVAIIKTLLLARADPHTAFEGEAVATIARKQGHEEAAHVLQKAAGI